jgi:hypothetical protein
MKIAVFLFVGLVFMEPMCFAENNAKDVDLTTKNGSAYLVFNQFGSARLDLTPYSGAAEISQGDILFGAEDNGVTYLVIHLIGPTRLQGGGGYCGAGEEENLVWLKLSHTSILAAMSILYGSCAFSIEHHDINIAAGELTIKGTSYSESREYVIRYNSKMPQQGLISTYSISNN